MGTINAVIPKKNSRQNEMDYFNFLRHFLPKPDSGCSPLFDDAAGPT